ncbi:lysophospholipid acyltransferase family protein [Desulfococcus sp.]|uniref:lysophospholipid acyltransferase family protein n=1 Tax=Desulfococcus sp. TaxID=2025834 RepID=UPI003592ECB4
MTRKQPLNPQADPAGAPKLIQLPLGGRVPFRNSLVRLIEQPVEKLLSLDKINTVYAALADAGCDDFFCRALELLGISYRVSDADLEKIPGSGPLIVVANHPFGGIEGVILGKILTGVRHDVKILGNHLLQRISPISDRIIPVDVFNRGSSVRANASAYREAARWVRGGGALITFPAGEVSHFHLRRGRVEDRPWPSHIGALVRMTRPRVLPIFIPGRNSALFNLLGIANPRLRTVMLPRELIRKCASTLPIMIGRPIIWQKLSGFPSDEMTTRYLRFHTCFLENRLTRNRRITLPWPRVSCRVKDRAAVVPELPKDALRKELAALPPSHLLASQKEFAVYVARADQMPNIMREIARQREISFRDVCEGTGKPLDMDRFDAWYLQLFLWDREAGEIAGAYRLGPADEILARYGLPGLYTHSLFHIQERFLSTMGNAIELGRSFIQPKYRLKHGCLALLWRGIGEFVARNCRYRALFGPVSISRDYHRISRNLMVEFLRTNTRDARLPRLVSPRNPYRHQRLNHFADARALLPGDVENISMLVSEIESDGKGVPTLIKHYLKLNGKFIDFNVDRQFSNVVDGLVVVDLMETDPKILRRFMGEAGLDAFSAHHGRGEAEVA